MLLGSNLVFRGLNLSFFSAFLIQLISFDIRKTNSTIEQRKCKGLEKRDQHLNSKIKFNNQISQPKRKFTY